MPEGPEVRTTTDWLHRVLAEQTIQSIVLSDSSGRLSQQIQSVAERLPIRVNAVDCKGKQILIMSDDFTIVQHMIMTGSWTEHPGGPVIAEFKLQNGNSVYYNDTRKMGHFKIVANSEILDYLNSTGIDILRYIMVKESVINRPPWYREFDYDNFAEIISGKGRGKLRLCEFLLEQRYFCGIGNYLRCDIMYQAGLSPTRLLSELDDEELGRLYNSIVELMWESYVNGGCTISDYQHPDGGGGNYQTKIYQKSNFKFSDKKKRTVYWDPKHQY